MFERYYGEGSKVVPRSSLSTITRRNLGYLEQEQGFRFGDSAIMAQFGHRPSYIIEGEGPNSEEVVFERRETGSPKAGQTYIWIDGKKTRLGDFGLPLPTSRGLEWDIYRKLEDEKAEELEEARKPYKEKEKVYFEESMKAREARERSLDAYMEEMDTEGLDGPSRSGIRALVYSLVGDKLPSYPVLEAKRPSISDILSKEEKKKIKQQVKEYREDLRKYEV